jgi:hypothetical protein
MEGRPSFVYAAQMKSGPVLLALAVGACHAAWVAVAAVRGGPVTVRAAILVGALAALAATGCAPTCADPTMSDPASATWSTTGAVPSPSGGAGPVTTVLVRWSALGPDRLPPSYYGLVEVRPAMDAGTLVASVAVTGPRELSVQLRDLEVFLASSTRLELELTLPDPRESTRCSHWGGPDAFAVPLTLEFDRTAHTVSASFGAMRIHRGACDVGGGPGGGTGVGDVGAVSLSLLVAAAARARRREIGARMS